MTRAGEGVIMGSSEKNGNSISKAAVISALFSILMLLLGGWVSYAQGQLGKIPGLEEGQRQVSGRLDRIETKIDRLIERRV